MSSFVHDQEHIHVCVDAILQVDATWRGKHCKQHDPNELGTMLLTANVDSVLTLYPDVDAAELAYYRKLLDTYRWQEPTGLRRLGVPEQIGVYTKALSSMDYQCCETSEWRTSDIAELIQMAILTQAQRLWDLPEVADAWCFNETNYPY